MLKTGKIDAINIGLMIISCIAAFIMPFEVFLFAYAFMGPLHYLTEISWLHDRQYFAKGKYDYFVLLGIGLLITYEYFGYRYHLWPFTEANKSIFENWNMGDKLLCLALLGAVVLAFVKSVPIKIICLFLAFLFSNQAFKIDDEGNRPSSNLAYIVSSFVPTLIHVYVFTGIFMLFGALKSRSKMGLYSFLCFIICPILLIVLFRDQTFVPVTKYGMAAFGNNTSQDGFFDLNQSILGRFFDPRAILESMKGVDVTKDNEDVLWNTLVYKSSTGILIMRFIAFAYTYHYLNWFSKTEIIRWHKVPKVRFIIVIVLWIASVALYAYSYAIGLQWLFFLSFSHVLLEFPLNWHSFVGIFKELGAISKTGFKPVVQKT